MNIFQNLRLLKFALILILGMHSIPGMLDGGVNAFGTQYLDKIGFAPMGLFIAWAVKLSHVALIVSYLTNKFVAWTGWINVIILIAGIIMVHSPQGWFVVGGGQNGIEFNVLLIAAIVKTIYHKES